MDTRAVRLSALLVPLLIPACVCGSVNSPPPPKSCDDGVCDEGETCINCPADCGLCAPACGDRACGDDETCTSCPSDCGVCAIVVGEDCVPATYVQGRVFRVGPNDQHATINALLTAEQLGPGDRVEVEGGVTYPALRLEEDTQGAEGNPIFFVGVPGPSGGMPLLSGGTNTLHFQASHHVVFQGFEITGGTERCVFHEAHDVTLCQSVVHGCMRHGILGADIGSGSLLLDRIEVYDTGGEIEGENLKHPVYIATDPEAYPDNVFRIQNSFLHDNNGGNAIKSRAYRTEVYFNWIEVGPLDYYTIELVGSEEFDTRQDSDVVGNVLIHNNTNALRFGGDGTESSDGRVRFDNNTVILVGDDWDEYTPVIRFAFSIDAFEASNNVFYKLGGGAISLTRDDAEWVGARKVAGHNNWIPAGSTAVPGEFTATISGSGDPGFTAEGSVATLNLTVTAGSTIHQAGAALVNGPTGFEIDAPLLVPTIQPPTTRPVNVSSMVCDPRPVETPPTVGAHAGP